MKLLLVEDEVKIASFVKKGLESQGMVVDHCMHGDDGYTMALTGSYDIILLDIMLPGRDGLSILQNLRQKRNRVPIIMITARGELNERLEGLNLGADDYLVKPFYIDELIARIHAISRRVSSDSLNVYTVAGLQLDLISREVVRDGVNIDLSAREFNLLELFMRSPGRVFTRVQILERVWNYDFDPNTNIVDVYIKRVRSKVDEPFDEDLIETVRGVGYKMKKLS